MGKLKRGPQERGQSSREELASVTVPDELTAIGGHLMRQLFTAALRVAHEEVAEPLQRAHAILNDVRAELTDAQAEVARLEAVEQLQLSNLERLTAHVRDLDVCTAAQQATIREKAAAMARVEAQLADAQRKLEASNEELATVRASSGMAETLRAQLETLSRSVQELASAKHV